MFVQLKKTETESSGFGSGSKIFIHWAKYWCNEWLDSPALNPHPTFWPEALNVTKRKISERLQQELAYKHQTENSKVPQFDFTTAAFYTELP